MNRAAEITVCVVVKNRRELMSRCLDGLVAQTVRPHALVIVDNTSTDGTYEMVQDRAARMPFPTTVVRHAGSLGQIRNVAVQLADTEFIAFTDSDCVPRPEWIAQLHVAWANSTGQLSVVQGRTMPDPSAPRTRWDATQDIGALTQLFEACNISYRRSPLLSTPGFDESIGFFGEDTAAGWHVLRQGGAATFAPDAIVEHAVTPCGLRWHLRRATHYGNFCALVRKFPEMRERLLWRHYFLRRRNAQVWLALLGLLAVIASVTFMALTGDGLWLGLTGLGSLALVPWVRASRPSGASATETIRALCSRAVFDLVVVTTMVVGSVRRRTLVL